MPPALTVEGLLEEDVYCRISVEGHGRSDGFVPDSLWVTSSDWQLGVAPGCSEQHQ